jgi:TetR/AcrR family fatty acid metabolism transcriptional regulator
MYREFLKRKEKVIITAIDILNDAGIQGLTTKELARREGITEPAIYRQYDSKQDIILAILDRYALFDEVIINTIKEQDMDPLQGILYFAEAYAGYYQSYPQITTVMFSFDVFRYEEETNNRMTAIMKRRSDFVAGLIERGQEQDVFDRGINAADLADVILGLIWSATYKWRLDDSKGDLKKRITEALKWMLG